MILVTESNLVIAQADNITKEENFYRIGTTIYSDNTLKLVDTNIPENMEVGLCTYEDGKFEKIVPIIEPIPEPEPIIDYTLEEAKEIKIKELSETCSSVIYNGADIQIAEDNIQHFTLTEQDQLNLSGIGLKLLMGAEQIAWHEDDETKECQYYSAQDAQKIIGTLTTFKEYHITYFRDLRIYVNSLQTVEEVNAIWYGMVLPEEFKSQVLKDYEVLLKGE